jgi:NADP-dependent alcohol dehydrogenase
MALNGLIKKLMIEQAWIGLADIQRNDHARTLAIIAPSLYKVMFETKKAKLNNMENASST